MSSNYGEGTAIDPATARGSDWPCLRQFCVFMENRVGRLHELLRQIERHDLRIIALSVVDTVDFAVARLMVHDSDRAREIFALSQFTVIENDILGVELSDDSQPFVRIFQALLSAEINISYTYPLLYHRRGPGAIAIHVDNIDQATRVLASQGHHVLTENDILNLDDYS